MPSAPRHSKPKRPISRLMVPTVAAAALTGATAAFVFYPSGSAAPPAEHSGMPVTSAASGLADDQIPLDVHHRVASRMARESARAARSKYLAAKAAAARRARQRAAAQAAARQAAARQAAARQAAAQPSSSPTPSAAPSSSGGDAAHSALGVCIRNAEEGGSYAWGPGNGGGAYQFLLSTWEKYGGAASEYGVAGPAYQDQIFDNAIAAGGASNWTAYDGC
jgi:Transglycosylase-like domain